MGSSSDGPLGAGIHLATNFWNFAVNGKAVHEPLRYSNSRFMKNVYTRSVPSEKRHAWGMRMNMLLGDAA
jgi:hypothetical protein